MHNQSAKELLDGSAEIKKPIKCCAFAGCERVAASFLAIACIEGTGKVSHLHICSDHFGVITAVTRKDYPLSVIGGKE